MEHAAQDSMWRNKIPLLNYNPFKITNYTKSLEKSNPIHQQHPVLEGSSYEKYYIQIF